KQLNINKSHVEELRQLQSKALLQSYEENLEGSKLTFESLRLFSENLLSIISSPKVKYGIVILFTHFDCASCVSRELRIWEEVWKKFSFQDSVKIFAIVETKQIQLESRGVISFPVFIDVKRSIFSKLTIPHGHPVVILWNRENERVIYCHLAEAGDENKSFIFQNKVLRFLNWID
ncbi:MAG: hypothetical protein Q9P14_01250, partial [candidate division KSB1 bacterium]|nr:hypothetical protein [candidate division KSB1 bacterium]